MQPRRDLSSRPRERGAALAIAIFSVLVLLMTAGTALLITASDSRATRNYRSASQVHFVAESGIAHALQLVNGPGVLNFQNEVVTQWSTLFGTSARSFTAAPGYTYTVSAIADGTDPANWGRFVSTATGPQGEVNRVVARVNRTNVPRTAVGAVYLASDTPTNATFTGNAFQVDGTDRNYTGGLGPGAAVPGLSTRNDTNTQEAIDSLGSGQRDNVTGLGYQAGPPIVPSIMTSGWALSMSQLNQLAADILTLPGVINNLATQVNGNAVFGTVLLPLITHFPQSVEIKGNGNASGAGILIVDGDLTIKGSLSFKGLIIVRGRTQVIGDTEVTGNGTIYGALWTNDINLVVGGSAIVQYSTQALALANLVSGTASALPTPVQLVSLADCAQVPSGSGNCP